MSDAITRHLELGDVRVERVAQCMGLSRRTLQRRLTENGTTFRQIVERARREQAAHYLLMNELPIREISRLLGFSCAPTFHRAFKKWTGSTPERFRASRARPQPACEPVPVSLDSVA